MSNDCAHEILVDDIEVGKQNALRSDPTRNLAELAASIKAHGLLQPVLLGGSLGHPPYRLISGRRRFLAHKHILKAKTIRAIFVPRLAKEEAVLRLLVEHLQRVDLTHTDAAKAITRLYKTHGRDELAVQKLTGLPIQRVRDYIRIEAQASPKMKSMLRQGKVTPAEVKRALQAAQGQIAKTEELLGLMASYTLTRHQKRRIVEYGEADQSATAQEIFDRAIRPRIEQSVVVGVSESMLAGLRRASDTLARDVEGVAAHALEEWLSAQGFTNESAEASLSRVPCRRQLLPTARGGAGRS